MVHIAYRGVTKVLHQLPALSCQRSSTEGPAEGFHQTFCPSQIRYNTDADANAQ